jgi:uncharacterized protein YcnI
VREKASTVRVDVQFPNGIYVASPTVKPGWESRVITKKLPKPTVIELGWEPRQRLPARDI